MIITISETKNKVSFSVEATGEDSNNPAEYYEKIQRVKYALKAEHLKNIMSCSAPTHVIAMYLHNALSAEDNIIIKAE